MPRYTRLSIQYLTTTPEGIFCHYPHIIDEKTEAQKGEVNNFYK